MFLCRFLDLISERDILNWTTEGTPEYSPTSSLRLISTQSISYDKKTEDTDNGVKRVVNITIKILYSNSEYQQLLALGPRVIAKLYYPFSSSFVGEEDNACILSLDTDRNSIKISLKHSSAVL